MNVQLINHWSSVWRLSLDSSVIELNVSIIIYESLHAFPVLYSDCLKESNRTNGKMSFVALICKTEVFVQRPVKASQRSENSAAPVVRNYGPERRKNGAKTETQGEVHMCVHLCLPAGGPGDSAPSLMALRCAAEVASAHKRGALPAPPAAAV